MKLILFGGIQGVGKTTLLSLLEKRFGGQITFLNPGELFRRYFYTERIKTIDEIEEMIVSKLGNMPHETTVIAHWHYAVRRPEGFIPQVSFSRLQRIAENSGIEHVVLLSLGAPKDVIYERRLKDYKDKRRELTLQGIQQETDADEEFLIKHHDIFSQALGKEKVTVFRLTNHDLGAAEIRLYNFLTELFR